MSKSLLFATVTVVAALSSINSTAVAVAFPVIIRQFDASLVEASWIFNVYHLVFIAVMPLAGKASEIFGRKLIFLLAIFLFGFGSILCAIAPNIQFLFFARFVQALGGGAFMPVCTAIVADAFPDRRQQFIGLISSIFSIGQVIGPNLGGWLVSAFDWRSVFWFNVPFVVLAFVLIANLLKRSAGVKGDVDLAGAGLFTGSVVAILTGVTQMGSSHGGSGVPWAFSVLFVIIGVGLMFALVRHIQRAREPIFDREVLLRKPFLAANVFNFFLGALYSSVMSFFPLYAVTIYGASTLESGLVMTPLSVGMTIASVVTSFYLVRWGYRWPIILGTVTTAACLFVLGMELPAISLPGVRLSGTVLLAAITFLPGIGMGVVFPATNNACIDLMPHRIASISGVRGMFRQAGGAVGIAIISLVLSYSSDIARGFTIAFFGLAAVLLMASPLIFIIPSRPVELPRN